jgi:hypothetical protein
MIQFICGCGFDRHQLSRFGDFKVLMSLEETVPHVDGNDRFHHMEPYPVCDETVAMVETLTTALLLL